MALRETKAVVPTSSRTTTSSNVRLAVKVPLARNVVPYCSEMGDRDVSRRSLVSGAAEAPPPGTHRTAARRGGEQQAEPSPDAARRTTTGGRHAAMVASGTQVSCAHGSHPDRLAPVSPSPDEAARERAIAELVRVSPVISALGEHFAEAGHEISLVGGSVRDALLGRLGNDLDFTTSAHPDEVEQLLSGHVDALWDIGKAFGTIGARIGQLTCEITTYRTEEYDAESRKPFVQYGTSLEGDLGRRDFTVNAMAVALPELGFVDPFDGVADLASGTLRTPGRPEDSFDDDPLRMLRAARFAAQLDFEVEPSVLEAITGMAERSAIVSAERIRDEFSKLVLSNNPRAGLRILVDTRLADQFIPELPALQLEIDEHHRHKDVYEHTLTVVEQAIDLEQDGPDLTLRLAALLHDIGKPATRRFENGGGVSSTTTRWWARG